MNHDDILHQIPDYVLGLLPRQQMPVVQQHVAHCVICQEAVVREKRFEQLVRSTVDTAGQTDPSQIRSLMPEIPRQRNSSLFPDRWRRQLAPALLVLMLLFGGLLLNQMLPDGRVPAFVATAHAATATSTITPTATLVQGLSGREQKHDPPAAVEPEVQEALPLSLANAGQPLETPDPMPTPVAAVMQIMP